MKTVYVTTAFVLALLMLFLPLIGTSQPDVLPTGTLPDIPSSDSPLKDDKSGVSEIKVYMTEQDKIETFSTEDYIFGVVAAEMPALYESEALKAQAVAAYTYTLCRMENNSAKKYDITDSYKTDQAFITVEQAREKWGEDAAVHEAKIRDAVNAVLYEKITYNGNIILAVYHAISSGNTENASEVWDGEYPYLASVESVGDKLSPNYLTSTEVSLSELEEKLSGLADFSGEPETYFGACKRSSCGSVKTVSLCGKEVSGSDIRAALELRSSNFEVSYENKIFTFTVKGYGHGLGMSQYGAHYMAMQGSTYKEILTHYYTDCKIE